MDRTNVTCTSTESIVGADILDRNDRYLKVALDGATIALELFKDTPNTRIYVGYMFGMEFTSEGT